MKRMVCAAGLLAVGALVTACSSSGGSTPAGSQSQSQGQGGGAAVLKVACSTGLQQVPRELAAVHHLDVANGVKPECIQVQTGPEQSAALISGSLDVAITNPSLLAPLLDKGQDLVVTGVSWNTNFFDIIVRKGYPLPHQSQGWKGVMQDLKGAKIGVVSRGGAAEAVARSLYTEAGLSADSATYISTGLPNTTLPALQNKSIDAALTFEPGVTLAVKSGIATEPFSIQAGSGPKDMVYPDLLFVTTRSYAKSHAALLCDFNKAWDAGIKYMTDSKNRASVEATVESFLGLDAATTKASLARDLPFFPKTTAVPDSLNTAFAFLAKNHLASKVYTTKDVAVNVCA